MRLRKAGPGRNEQLQMRQAFIIDILGIVTLYKHATRAISQAAFRSYSVSHLHLFAHIRAFQRL